MSPPKPISEKIFDILGSLVADPFRRWLIVGYVIFNPDLFVLFFTSEEKFEIFQQYFKFQYYHWLSSAIGDYFSLRIHAIYQFLSWPLYHIIFPFLFSYFWCFAYPRFEIWYRERTKENQDKIKDIKDNNILYNQLEKNKKELASVYTLIDIVTLHNDLFNYAPVISNSVVNFAHFINSEIDNYNDCITQDLADSIKEVFQSNFKERNAKYLQIDNDVNKWDKDKCELFLYMIHRSIEKIKNKDNPHITRNNQDRSENMLSYTSKYVVDKAFIMSVMLRFKYLTKKQ